MTTRAALAAFMLCLPALPVSAQVDVVYGDMFNLTNTTTSPNGSWNWCTDERVIIDDTDPNNTLMILSTVSAGSGAESGDIDILWRNLDTGVQGEFELHNQLEQDDHNMAALYQRPDGRYVAIYSKHTSDLYTRYRVSTNPHDPTAWEPEQIVTNGNNATYNNIYYLDEDNGGSGRLYNFTRADNWDPTVHVSYDQGSTWTHAGKLLTQGGTSDRPYLEYASHGDKIHFIATEEHPRQVQNSIYAGYVKDGVLYNYNDEVMDDNIFDANGISPTQLTTVFKNGEQFNGTTMNRAWTISLELDNTHNPVGIISVRANDNPYDHRYLYARFDGVDWQVNEMAAGGSYMYDYENDYMGLMSIDPQNPNVVYMANDIDPRNGTTTAHHELYKGVTSDFGQTWTWTAITENSTVDNLRPAIPEWDGHNTAIAWLRGTYGTWSDWNDLEVYGMTLDATDAKALIWRGDATSPNAWDINNNMNWDSGGGLTDPYLDGAEVAFDDTASSFNVNIATTVTPSNTAFNNESNAYTVTGAGISGSGMLRVLGGGEVTLANGANTYTGKTMIARGTLAMSGNASLDNTPHIDVTRNGTFDVSASTGGSYALNNQVLTIDGDVIGNIVATNNSTVHVNSSNSMNGNLTAQSGSLIDGAGKVSGNLTSQASTVRVGGDGLDVQISQFIIDDFEGYSLGDVNTVASPTWIGHAGSDVADIEDDGTGNKVLTFGGLENYGAASMLLPVGAQIDNTETSTFFFRFNSKTDDPDSSFGLSDQSNTGNSFVFSDYEAQVRIVDDAGASGTYMLDARDGGGFTSALTTGLATDTWYNLWMVVDQTTDTYDIYLNTGSSDATSGDKLNSSPLSFRNGTTDTLISILGAWGPAPITNGVRYDDMTFLQGADLTNPLGGLDPVLLGTGLTLTVQGDYTMDGSAVLELDAVGPGVADVLTVGGNLHAAGTLVVTLVDEAPVPQLGDQIDILDFTTATGSFDSVDLPTLADGLAWNTSALLTTGIVEVMLEGDLNGDGFVGLDDLDIVLCNWNTNITTGDWSQGDPSGDGYVGLDDLDIVLGNWNAGTPPQALADIPEPGTCLLVGGLGGMILLRPHAD